MANIYVDSPQKFLDYMPTLKAEVRFHVKADNTQRELCLSLQYQIQISIVFKRVKVYYRKLTVTLRDRQIIKICILHMEKF